MEDEAAWMQRSTQEILSPSFTMSVLFQRARASGVCPPSLLSESGSALDGLDGFDASMSRIVDRTGFFLQQETEITNDFNAVLKKLGSAEAIVGTQDLELKKQTLRYRRCVLLAVVGGTPIEYPSLARIVADGYLNSVKLWLDEILATPEGSVDMLLHLLSSIVNLPVTRSVVKDSGMGNAIGAIGKHAICKGTPNEATIKERVQQVKDAWFASVKARKPLEAPKEAAKREAPEPPSPSPAKRVKADVEQKKTTSFTSLLKKVSGSPNGVVSSNKSDSPPIPDKAAKPVVSVKPSHSETKDLNATETVLQTNGNADKRAKKIGLRVKWADHFGGQIAFSHVVEADDVENPTTLVEATVSWSDRKRRDRIHEKELLAKAKKSKLLDDEDIDLPPPMMPSISWQVPLPLPERPELTQPQLDSPEYLTQQNRMLSIAPARYISDFDVPLSPDPLSDVEQALDMTSQASAIITPIPFFVPQVAAPEPSTGSYVDVTAGQSSFSVPDAQPVQDGPASIEVLQSLGLPLFLIGQPVRALQTIAASPGLLSTLVDVNGMYDQTRLLNLVQTLSSTGSLPPQSTSQYQAPTGNIYGNSYNSSIYGETPSLATASSRTVVRKSDEGNLHVSGYGPGITESDLIAAFSPYVRVDEVVLKGNFAFVNTSDPLNAQRAREALTGTLLNGMPLRINNATRKVRDSSSAFGATPAPVNVNPFVPTVQPTFGSQAPVSVQPVVASLTHPSYGAIHPNIDSVRDDKGNGATKNLFVAGYGPGTTEQMLRDLFGQFALVTGVVSKGNFAFVNTSDRHGAVVARENLGGTMFNGGILRINFAKETGRLGTSFDLTYGPNTGPNASRVRPQDVGYYGRG